MSVSKADVLLLTLTTWGRPVRKSRVQLQREVFNHRVLSLVMSLEGAMVLNPDLYSMKSILTCILTFSLLLSRCERAVCSAIEIVSSMDLLGQYAN